MDLLQQAIPKHKACLHNIHNIDWKNLLPEFDVPQVLLSSVIMNITTFMWHSSLLFLCHRHSWQNPQGLTGLQPQKG